ncbi:MAG: cob(I)yrinic acid a,c-diamide adenosyltransferase [Candidatus Omnitrophica bacterium]|nr:cob(I)yrinic acid a,c-diamide adenosyltransferase [Candidatus Omnitrophota bacterium]
MKKTGLVQVYYGRGKGKTTSALGLALRAWGWGRKIIIFQFFKPKNLLSGEVKAIEKLGEGIKIVRFGQRHPIFCKKIKKEKARNVLNKALKEIRHSLKVGNYDLVILDEILNAVDCDLISEGDIIELIKNKSKSTELIITGRPLVNKLREYADYISEIKEIKHPFQKGIKAREGIEY